MLGLKNGIPAVTTTASRFSDFTHSATGTVITAPRALSRLAHSLPGSPQQCPLIVRNLLDFLT